MKLTSLVKFVILDSSLLFYLDSCVTVECANYGETCQNGVCQCGNEPTCEGNTDAPVCDTEKGKCVRCK